MREPESVLENETQISLGFRETNRSPNPGQKTIQMMSRDNRNYSIVKIGQNTEKSLRELRRLAVTKTPVKDHQLTLV